MVGMTGVAQLYKQKINRPAESLLGKAGLPYHITGCSLTLQLFKFFFPLGAGDPFFVDLVIEAVALGLSQEIVQIVQKIGIAFVDGPGQRFVGERVAQK